MELSDCKIIKSKMHLVGTFKMEIVRDGKIIHTEIIKNGITDVGFNKMIDVMFGNITQITTWYIGLIDNSSFSGLATGDTMASHTGWAEVTSYSGSNRKTWTPATASSKATANASPAAFTMSGSATLKGMFVTSQADKTVNTGTLWSSAVFDSTYAVLTSDVINITYGLAFAEV